MTYENYRSICLICGILALVMLGVSVCLFLFLHISAVIGDLTGANARKGVAKIQSQMERNPGSVSPSNPVMPKAVETEKISTTDLLDTTDTVDFHSEIPETAVLQDGMIFQQSEAVFQVEYEIMFIHTEERIY